MREFTVIWARNAEAALHARGCADIARDVDRNGGDTFDFEAADWLAAQDVLAEIAGFDPDTMVADPKPCAKRNA